MKIFISTTVFNLGDLRFCVFQQPTEIMINSHNKCSKTLGYINIVRADPIPHQYNNTLVYTIKYNRSQESAMRNDTVTTFILLGLTGDPQLQVLIFIFLFLTYMLSITGNLTIISLILLDSHLKTAMYHFLQNFSFLEISFTSACIPRYLYNIATGDKVITYNACASQSHCCPTSLSTASVAFLLSKGHVPTLTVLACDSSTSVEKLMQLIEDKNLKEILHSQAAVAGRMTRLSQ
ncbi:hypothetical protein HPG69_018941 [Diceros bicornis minor]|uniref:Uncharacterized protein n=1 Tax=Diceros bicornis minor TaxID=77932 RepID=A0A7J7FAA2_DICBM|nr:hypothetical protein HPG69_018941 [Diceros bicornis minor]